MTIATLALAATAGAQEPPAPTPEQRRAAAAENDLGVKLLDGGEPEKSLEHFRAALDVLPDEPVIRANAGKAHHAIGRRLYDEKRFADAARAFHEAATLDAKELEHAHAEGVALAQSGDDRGAVAVLGPVATADPKRRATLIALGQSLYRLGKLKDAIARWQRALELDAKDDGLRAALEKAKREAAVEESLDEDLGAPHFTIRVDGGKDLALARLVGRFLEDAYRDVGYDLGSYPKGEVPVVIYPRKTFRAATGAHEWMAASFDGKIRIPAEGIDKADAAETRRVVAHEFTHALIRSIGGPDVPAWIHEGLAQLEEGKSRRDALAVLAREPLPALDELTTSFTKVKDERAAEVRYAAALELVAAMAERGTRRGIVDVLARLDKGEKLDDAMKAVIGVTAAELYDAWRATLRR